MAVHKPVLLEEVLESFYPQNGQHFVDATAGEGGHTLEIAKRVKPNGRVLAIERDPEEIKVLQKNIEQHGLLDVVISRHGNFSDIVDAVEDTGVMPDGILFDLGFSSWHIEKSERGFSFQNNEPLDMRFDPSDESIPQAKEILNSWPQQEIEIMLEEYGEERNARKIAKEIVKKRKKKKLETTTDLVEIINSVIPQKGKINPATKTFQALRMVVNDELENIKKGIMGAEKVLKPEGKIAVITFHSLEDRLVKNIFRNWKHEGIGELINKNVIKPNFKEVKANPRSRSAKLRIYKKLKN